MKRPEARHLLDLLAALSHTTDFSVGCYRDDESRCHRSVLRATPGRTRREDPLVRLKPDTTPERYA